MLGCGGLCVLPNVWKRFPEGGAQSTLNRRVLTGLVTDRGAGLPRFTQTRPPGLRDARRDSHWWFWGGGRGLGGAPRAGCASCRSRGPRAGLSPAVSGRPSAYTEASPQSALGRRQKG